MQQSMTEARLSLLESKLAFQEHTIEELNQSVIRHELELTRMQEKLRLLLEKLKTAAPSIIASPAEETPPPHY